MEAFFMKKTSCSILLVVLTFCFSFIFPSNSESAVINLDKSFYVLPDPALLNNTDNDNDGYTENQGDCNDGNPAIHPGTVETCGDGIDHDCNGSDTDCPLLSVENRLLQLINQERNSAGLPTLVRDPGLDRIIHWHTYNMAADHFLNHQDKNSRSAKQRAWYYSGDGTVSCVELIQWWGGGVPSGDAHYNGYFNSPEHHDGYMEKGIYNLGPTTHVGVAVVAGTGPAGSPYEDSNGSYSGVFLCDKKLQLTIDPFSEN
jgi:uncharacterized protein YkwD